MSILFAKIKSREIKKSLSIWYRSWLHFGRCMRLDRIHQNTFPNNNKHKIDVAEMQIKINCLYFILWSFAAVARPSCHATTD